MSEDRPQGGSGTDPEKRAFTGGATMPPEQPDQPADGNEELLRPDGQGEGSDERGPGEDNPHGGYTNLPGYGG